MKRTRFIAIVLALVSSLHAEIRYNVVDLGLGTAWSINNKGQVVGDSYGATLFDTSGGGNNTLLGGMVAYSISDSGQIVGWGEVGSPSTHHAVLFDSTGQGNNIDLTPFATSPSYARSVNNYGQIVGESLYAATLFGHTGSGSNLSLFGGSANCINDNGQIVGRGSDNSFLYDTITQQTIWLGALLGGNSSYARSINNSGQIVGTAGINMGKVQHNHATLFDPTGGGNNIDLGTLGRANSDALSINGKGQIVGLVNQTSEQAGDCYATLFDSTGQGNNILLNDLIDPASGWNLMVAKSINDNGWIVGYGVNPDGAYHAFLLTPIPEPTTLLLLGLGGIILRKHAR